MEKQLQTLLEQAPELILTYGSRIIVAVLIFFVGKFIVGGISKSVENVMTKRGVDPTIGKFVKNILHYTGLMVIIIAALGELGIQTASFVAVIGAAGLAVGLALQGSLSNFASGVLIILFLFAFLLVFNNTSDYFFKYSSYFEFETKQITRK